MKGRFLAVAVGAALAATPAADAMPPAPAAPPLLMSAKPAHENPETAAAAPGYRAFREEEQKLRGALELAPTPLDRAARSRALAMFYKSHGLCFEALDALRRDDAESDSPEASLFAAGCDLAIGRYTAALERLPKRGDDEALRLRIVALTKVGAYREAVETYNALQSAEACRGDCAMSAAQAFYRRDDVKRAREALAFADPDAEGAALLRALLAFKADGDRPTRARLEAIAKGDGENAQHAQIALLASDLAAGRLAGVAANASLEAILLQRRGGDLERDALLLKASLADEAAFAAPMGDLQRVIELFPHADAAEQAARAIEARLVALAENQDVAPETAARLFYENIEYAPPGAAGDGLIRSLAARLRALDLLAEAAELLEHQTFQRLRGAARATLAGDLARLYLDMKRPDEALRVMRSTRYAGLTADAAAERRLIEAEALERLDRADAALALLDGLTAPSALRLKGEIAWRTEGWATAGAAYANYFNAGGGDDAAVRAAAAFLLAGDRDRYAEFAAAADERMESDAARALVRSLSMEGASHAEFSRAYERLFGADARS